VDAPAAVKQCKRGQDRIYGLYADGKQNVTTGLIQHRRLRAPVTALLPRVVEALGKCIETGADYRIEHRCLGADGIYRWFQVRGLPVRDAENTVSAWYLLLTDIDDRKRAEEALRASEIGANVILKATKVDGIYDRDPNLHAGAKRYEQITYSDALTQRLQVMDSTAFSLCMDNKIPIIVFDMNKPTNIRDAVLGKKIGTLVSE
jgi:hypothetical protein